MRSEPLATSTSPARDAVEAGRDARSGSTWSPRRRRAFRSGPLLSGMPQLAAAVARAARGDVRAGCRRGRWSPAQPISEAKARELQARWAAPSCRWATVRIACQTGSISASAICAIGFNPADSAAPAPSSASSVPNDAARPGRRQPRGRWHRQQRCRQQRCPPRPATRAARSQVGRERAPRRAPAEPS